MRAYAVALLSRGGPLLRRPLVRAFCGPPESESLVEMEFTLEQSLAQPLSEALMEVGALSVQAFDADAGTEVEEPIYREPPSSDREDYNVFLDETWRTQKYWNRTVVKAIAHERASTTIFEQVKDIFGEEALGNVKTQALDMSKDWVKEVEALRPPVTIKKLRIVLPWHEKVEGTLDLRIEGGSAFGTGEHPTTHMCCEWLQDQKIAFASVLDYGTGSGILALAALRCGLAADVVGVDLDQEAVEAAKRNSLLNGFKEHEANFYQVGWWQEKHKNKRHFDLVVANILLNPLLELCPTLAAFVHPLHGKLAISGIRHNQFDAFRHVYADYFHDVSITKQEEGWLLVTCERPKSS